MHPVAALLRAGLIQALGPMSEPIQLPKFWVLAVLQIAIAIAAVGIWFYFRTEAYMAGSPDPDLYAWSWSFQWMVFAIFWLPPTLVFTGILLGIERLALKPYYKAASTHDSQACRHRP